MLFDEGLYCPDTLIDRLLDVQKQDKYSKELNITMLNKDATPTSHCKPIR